MIKPSQYAINAIRLIFFSFGLSISSWAPLIPFIKIGLELSDAELGMVLFIFGMGALLTMPLAGWLIGKVGSKGVVILSSLAVSALLTCLPMAPSISSLYLVIFFFGIATGAMNVSMNTQAVEIEIAHKMPIMSGIHGWFSIGGLCGAGLVSFLLERGYSLQNSMLAVAFAVFANMLLTWRYLLPNIQQKQKEGAGAAKGPLRFPESSILLLGGLCFIAFMAEGAMLDWGAEYLSSYCSYELAAAGYGYAIFSVSMAIGRFLGDGIIKKFGSLMVFQAGCFLSASGFLCLVGVKGAELLGFALIGLGASNIVPMLFSRTGSLKGVSSSYALPIVTTCGYIGILMGPAMIGFIAQATSLSLAFFAMASLLTAIGVLGRFAIPAPNTESAVASGEVAQR